MSILAWRKPMSWLVSPMDEMARERYSEIPLGTQGVRLQQVGREPCAGNRAKQQGMRSLPYRSSISAARQMRS